MASRISSFFSPHSYSTPAEPERTSCEQRTEAAIAPYKESLFASCSSRELYVSASMARGILAQHTTASSSCSPTEKFTYKGYHITVEKPLLPDEEQACKISVTPSSEAPLLSADNFLRELLLVQNYMQEGTRDWR